MTTTEPTNEAAEGPTTPVTGYGPPETNEVAPLYEDGLRIEITHPIELAQLTDEISKATSRTVTLAMSGPTAGNEAISESNPAVLVVTPGSISKVDVQKVVDAHEPTEGYDVPENERRFAEVLQKLVDDAHAELTPEDLDAAVRGLMLRSVNAPSGTPLLSG